MRSSGKSEERTKDRPGAPNNRLGTEDGMKEGESGNKQMRLRRYNQ